jgi:hypothetical protein
VGPTSILSDLQRDERGTSKSLDAFRPDTGIGRQENVVPFSSALPAAQLFIAEIS